MYRVVLRTRDCGTDKNDFHADATRWAIATLIIIRALARAYIFVR